MIRHSNDLRLRDIQWHSNSIWNLDSTNDNGKDSISSESKHDKLKHDMAELTASLHIINRWTRMQLMELRKDSSDISRNGFVANTTIQLDRDVQPDAPANALT